ncbi:single-stranded DNA-binding protein [Nocardioides sp. STR2]|uniref:Single-stranded DNA-binding protein n=1 Tax=Nocardioides pini TaxID=2975053 RepID=A0ABT4CCP6_9ACTN|nr:single-stranded DNA-binding protein [Nocardioides pini]MCY4726724.1 single-stranded DNA-binding protein [Nocardioides pini]
MQSTIVGNLTDDPELRFTPSGKPVANMTVASTPRTFDRQTNEWVDGTTLFLRLAVWGQAAENVAESLVKGQQVIATGKVGQQNWETREGEKRSSFEMNVDTIGPSLTFGSAKFTRSPGRGGNGGGQQRQQQPDPWANQQQGGQQRQQGGWGNQQQQGGWGGGQGDEPPF